MAPTLSWNERTNERVHPCTHQLKYRYERRVRGIAAALSIILRGIPCPDPLPLPLSLPFEPLQQRLRDAPHPLEPQHETHLADIAHAPGVSEADGSWVQRHDAGVLDAAERPGEHVPERGSGDRVAQGEGWEVRVGGWVE